jgi:TonB-dependent SusC/RagA subfamily outer membrane receptor
MGGFLQQVLAQQIAVSGKVTNKSTGEALAGASVIVQGTQQATQTNAQGQFTINVAKGAVVVVSFEGFESVKNTINGPVTLGIALELSTANTLNDVIVIGYGTRKITKVSGAISTVKSEDIEKLKPVRTEEALQGRASGVNVIQNGTPGSKPTVLVRGIPSFSGTDPMVIIDGVPQTLTDFNSINAADIETINVLKDAAATAIYGVKGGNGVIVVTTKSGRKNQKTDITINGNYGVQNVINTIGVLNASEYAAMINE